MVALLTAASLMAQPQPVETELTFQGAGITLTGTLAAPADAKNHPAILLLPGSGPTDRNGDQPPLLTTGLLKQLSDRLVAEGYVTFRFDKRPAHTNQSQWPTAPEEISPFFSVPNHQKDVVAAYGFLKSRPEADPAKLFVLGHSEGGILAASTADQTKPAGLLLLGTPGRNMADVILEQVDRSIDNAPLDQDQKDALKAEHREIVKALTKEPVNPSNVNPGLVALYNPYNAHIWHGYFNVDPKSYPQAFSGPVFIANGALDVQVDPEKDAKPLHALYAARPNARQELLIVPKASHNFKEVQNTTELGFQGPLVPTLLDAIVTFLKKNTD